MKRLIGQRGYSRLGAVIALALTLLLVTGSSGSASGHKVVGNSYVIYNSGGNALLIAGPGFVDKATHDGTQDAVKAGVSGASDRLTKYLCVMCSENVYWHGNGSQGYNGSSVGVNFSDHDAGSCGVWTCDDYIDGQSHTDWWGSSPYNATAMDLNDTITETGCALSVNVSWPPGVGFGGGGDRVYWDSGYVGPTWYINHYYSGIHFWTYCARWYITQTSQANARFGFTYITPHANGGASI
jgi:hypothetical protein